MLSPLVPPSTAQPNQRRRMAVVLLCCALVSSADFINPCIASAQTMNSQPTGVRDFVEYWSASRLLLNGGNPYAPDQLLQLQRSVGWGSGAALIMWNPPWTLPFTLPFGLLNFNLSQFAWLFSQLLLILICTQALANLYGGASTNCRIEWCVALSFVPTVFVLIIGQISPMVLAGITGFLVLEKKRKSLAAGAMLAVVAIKPHLLYLFWLALLFWICRYRRWQVLLGAAVHFSSLRCCRSISTVISMASISICIIWKESSNPSIGRRRHCEIFSRCCSIAAIGGWRACRRWPELPGWDITGTGTKPIGSGRKHCHQSYWFP